MRRELVSAAIITILVVALFLPPIIGQDEERADGGVLAEIFIRVIHLTESGDVRGALTMIEPLVNTSLPPDIMYIHRDVYRGLKDLLDLIERVNGLLANVSESPSPGLINQVRGELLNLYGARLNIEDDLMQYKDALLKHVRPFERTYYKKLLDRELDDFLNYIDGFIVRSGEQLRDVEVLHGLRLAEINLLSIPREVYPASSSSIEFSVAWLSGSLPENLTLIVSLGVGWRTIAKYIYPLNDTGPKIIGLIIPSTRDLAAMGIDVSYKEPLRAYCVVSLYGSVDGEYRVLGANFFSLEIISVKPILKIHVPSIAYYGEDIEITVDSQIEYPTNISVLLDGVNIAEISVFPGVNRVVIPSENVSKGYHTIIFDVAPVAKYTAYRYSASLAVAGRPVKADLIYPRDYLWPVTAYHVLGGVRGYNDSQLYLWVYRGDTLVEKIQVNGSFSVDVHLPPPFFISVDHLRILVGPDDPRFDPYVVEADVISVNLLGLLGFALVGLLGVYLGFSYEREIIIRSIEARLRRLRSGVSEQPRLAGFREVIVRGLVRSRVAYIYWRFVERFPKILGRAFPYETLREYLRRVRVNLGDKAALLFEELTLLVERDLYSRERVEESRVRRLLRRVRDELG